MPIFAVGFQSGVVVYRNSALSLPIYHVLFSMQTFQKSCFSNLFRFEKSCSTFRALVSCISFALISSQRDLDHHTSTIKTSNREKCVRKSGDAGARTKWICFSIPISPCRCFVWSVRLPGMTANLFGMLMNPKGRSLSRGVEEVLGARCALFPNSWSDSPGSCVKPTSFLSLRFVSVARESLGHLHVSIPAWEKSGSAPAVTSLEAVWGLQE